MLFLYEREARNLRSLRLQLGVAAGEPSAAKQFLLRRHRLNTYLSNVIHKRKLAFHGREDGPAASVPELGFSQ